MKSKKIKVLFITTSDLSGRSGHNIATHEIVEAFIENYEISLILVCPKPKYQISELIKNKTFKTIYFNNFIPKIPKNPFYINNFIANLSIIIKSLFILSKIKNINFMVVRLSSMLYSPIIIKMINSIPLFLLIRGLSNFRNNSKIKIINKMDKLIAKKNINYSERIYVAYHELKYSINKYVNSNKIEVFNNAINPKKFKILDKLNARNIIRKGLNKDDFVIGFIGSIQRRHHLEELIASVENIHSNKECYDEKRRIKLLIVGQGPLLSQLKRYVQKSDHLHPDSVIFTGFIKHDIIQIYISACDVLYGIVSPDTVSNPIKCYEYLAVRRPIITSHSNDLNFVVNKNCGVILESIDLPNISNAILEFYYKDEIELLQMGKNGREYVLEHHCWENLPRDIMKYYREKFVEMYS